MIPKTYIYRLVLLKQIPDEREHDLKKGDLLLKKLNYSSIVNFIDFVSDVNESFIVIEFCKVKFRTRKISF